MLESISSMRYTIDYDLAFPGGILENIYPDTKDLY